MVLFRADGNSNIGLGHVMRNMSIADTFRAMGENCCFVMADDTLSKFVGKKGYGVRVLGTPYNRMQEELPLWDALLDELNPKLIFVDSYFVTIEFLTELKGMCGKKNAILVYIDDLLAFPYVCDVLVNYNIYATESAYRKLYVGELCPNFLLGTRYAPLRAEFQTILPRTVRQKATEIMISTGGTDTEHICVELVRSVTKHDEWKGYQFHFVVGTMNEDREEIENLVRMTSNVILHENVKKMSDLMSSCDVAISAAGSTLYELCATQTPTITYVLADNQIPGAEGFASQGVLMNVGDVREIGSSKLAEKLLIKATELLIDYDERASIASRMKQVVDGKGTERIAKELRCIEGKIYEQN